jgi:preprotein translocase subunit SecG
MQNVILVVHILACLIVTGLVLIQKSEGGGLGIGGGGGGGAGSLMSGRGAAGALVRSTIMFAGIFFVTSLALTTLANRNTDTRTNVERALGADEDGATGPVDLLDPTVPLLEGQEGLSTTPAPETAEPGVLIDPTADMPPADQASDVTPETEPETGNPQ